MNNQTQQLIKTMTTMMMMSMGVGMVKPIMLQSVEPRSVIERSLTYAGHEQITGDIDNLLKDIVALQRRLPRYLEIIKPYVNKSDIATLKKLNKSSTGLVDDLTPALRVLKNIEREGLH